MIVAVERSQVVGFGALIPFRARQAYRHTVENSVYVRADRHGLGIGKALLMDLLQRATALGHRTVIAAISADQAQSVNLHRGLGFFKTAHLEQVGFKFDRWLDVVYLQRHLWT